MIRSSSGGRDIVVRWRILAAQRLDHLIELHKTGRWKLYHSEQVFLALMSETREALSAWERLAPPDAALDKRVEIEMAQLAGSESGLNSSPPIGPLFDIVLADGVGADHDLREP